MGRIKDFFTRLWRGTSTGALTTTSHDAIELRAADVEVLAQLDESTMLTSVQSVYNALIGSGDYSPAKALKYAMRHSVWVGRSAKILADAAGSLPPRAEVEVNAAEEEYEPLPKEHPFAKLLALPAPGKPWPLWNRELIHQLLFRGRVDFVIVRSSLDGMSETQPGLGLPVELQLLELRKTETIRDRYNNIVGFRDLETLQIWSTDEVLTIYDSDAYDTRESIAAYEWVRPEAEQDHKAVAWNEEAFDNRLGADVLIRLLPNILGDGEVAEMWDSEEDWKAALKRFRANYLGAKKARSPIFTAENVDIDTIGNNGSHVDIDFTEGRKLLREGETAGMGVPPMMAGIMDAAALNNFGKAKEVLYELSIIPYWRMLAAFINTRIAPEFGEGHRAHWDESKVPELFPRYQERWTAACAGAKRHVPWSELNATFDLGLTEWTGWDNAAPPAASALLEILGQVREGLLDAISAELVIITSYPSVALEIAREMVDGQVELMAQAVEPTPEEDPA